MKILGIDPGLQVCGYAVIQTKLLETQLIEAGVFRTDGKAELAEQRKQAKLSKDWVAADAIRDNVTAAGFTIEDMPGHEYRIKPSES